MDNLRARNHAATVASNPSDIATFPGDLVIPNAAMIYNRTRHINAPPETIWPWIVQLGKSRGGWYLPHSWERWMPEKWRAARTVVPRWQSLVVGDRVDDYGGKNEYFDVVEINMPRWLVYRSERFGTQFTWTLVLSPKEDGKTEVLLRFRGEIQSTGIKRNMIIAGGDFLDWITSAPMLAGLAERAEGLVERS